MNKNKNVNENNKMNKNKSVKENNEVNKNKSVKENNKVNQNKKLEENNKVSQENQLDKERKINEKNRVADKTEKEERLTVKKKDRFKFFKKVINVLKNKWLKESLLTIILVCLIIAIFILVNMVVRKADIKPIDFTESKRYSLSNDSKDQIKKVEQNVTIYFFGYSDSDTPVVLGKQYHDVNDKITVQISNTSERPDLASEYGITSAEKIIAVQSSQRYKTISSSDLYTYDSQSYQTIDVTEQKLTNAILDVTIVSKPKIYFLTGHGEYGISDGEYCNTLSKYITNDVNDVNTLDLLSSNVPENCDALIICNPVKDFTDVETEKIQTYINNGGKIMWLQDPYITIKNYDENNFKNTNKILSQFGISFSKGIVCEQSTDNMVSSYPDLIMPYLEYNSIVKDLYTDGKIIMADAGKINTVSEDELSKLNVTADSFVKTSEKAYYKEDYSDGNGLQKSDKDQEGEYTLGEILTKKIDDNKSAVLVAYSNAFFATNYQFVIGNSYASLIELRNNKDILLNTVAYLNNREDSIRIRKDTGVVSFNTANAKQTNIVKIIIFALPIIIIIVGIIVTIKRKLKR